jgi:SAM-dependent methyltransferase
VRFNERDREDFAFLLENARVGKALGLEHFLHLDQPIGIWNYIRIANEIAERSPAPKLLDWGCGMGQMTYLLRRRGFDVGGESAEPPVLPLARDVRAVRSTHPTQLPFADGAFGAVLSCGVLEHVDEFSNVGNEVRSLAEIRRVMRPHGHFFIYQLPQRYTWQEAITRTLRLGYAHPRRFSAREIRELLARTGYRVESLRRNNMLPKNLTGLPDQLRTLYSRFGREIIAVDDVLSRIPVLNQLAGVLELVARPT